MQRKITRFFISSSFPSLLIADLTVKINPCGEQLSLVEDWSAEDEMEIDLMGDQRWFKGFVLRVRNILDR